MVILDTCALIEALNTTPALSRKTTELIDAGAQILSISFAEIACKVKLGKLLMNVSTQSLYHQYSQLASIEIIDISVNDWINAIDLEWPDNKDPADRLITAYAIQKQYAIVTSDKKIKAYYSNVIW